VARNSHNSQGFGSRVQGLGCIFYFIFIWLYLNLKDNVARNSQGFGSRLQGLGCIFNLSGACAGDVNTASLDWAVPPKPELGTFDLVAVFLLFSLAFL